MDPETFQNGAGSTESAPNQPDGRAPAPDIASRVEALERDLAAAQAANANLVRLIEGICGQLDALRIGALGALRR